MNVPEDALAHRLMIATLMFVLMAGCKSLSGIDPGGEVWRLSDGRIGAVLYPDEFVVAQGIAWEGRREEGEWVDLRKERYRIAPAMQTSSSVSPRGSLSWRVVNRSAGAIIALSEVGPGRICIKSAGGSETVLIRDGS